MLAVPRKTKEAPNNRHTRVTAWETVAPRNTPVPTIRTYSDTNIALLKRPTLREAERRTPDGTQQNERTTTMPKQSFKAVSSKCHAYIYAYKVRDVLLRWRRKEQPETRQRRHRRHQQRSDEDPTGEQSPIV